MSKSNGGPAFPLSVEPTFQWAEPGMSLRDWFAGQALIAVVGNNQLLDKMSDIRSDKDFGVSVASGCYKLADAMLSAREASEPEQ